MYTFYIVFLGLLVTVNMKPKYVEGEKQVMT